MSGARGRCMVCGRERELSGGMCEECKAKIREEAVGKQKRIKDEAEKELRKKGVPPDKS